MSVIPAPLAPPTTHSMISQKVTSYLVTSYLVAWLLATVYLLKLFWSVRGGGETERSREKKEIRKRVCISSRFQRLGHSGKLW